jgi:hypothetical protein
MNGQLGDPSAPNIPAPKDHGPNDGFLFLFNGLRRDGRDSGQGKHHMI